MTDKTPNFQKGVPACFAPPIDSAKLDEYEKLASQATGPVADSIGQLIAMVRLFLETPKSTRPAETVHLRAVRDGKTITSASCIPLEDAEVERIWDAVPWEHELDAMGQLFESISNETHKPLRDAAYHLLWYGRELTRDREPMTVEMLGQ